MTQVKNISLKYPCHTEDERRALVLEDKTLNELCVDVAELGRHSRVEVYVKCPVCGDSFIKKLKEFLDGKGRTCSKPCQSVLRTFSQRKKADRETEEKKAKRIKRSKATWAAKSEKEIATITEKRRATVQKERGVDWATKDPKVQQKMSEGIKRAYEDPSVLQKRFDTNIRLYGHTNYLASEEGQAKVKAYNQERFGTDFPFEDPAFQAYARGVTQEKYGVNNIRELPEFRDNLKQWCIDNPDKTFCSAAEGEILDWTQEFYPDARKYRTFEHEIDVYIPDIEVGIEHNGLYYHDEDHKGNKYHLAKTLYFRDQGIRIIHIWENEWKDRKRQVKSFLRSALGKNENRVGARKCEVIWSNKKEDIKKVRQFLETYHIQGAPTNVKYVVKALYDGELVSVSTFGRHHRTGDKWVLSRFCTKENWTIQGILSKMSKLASKILKEDIISWADYRLSLGNGYEKAGWEFDELLRIEYFYHDHKGNAISKQSRQKRLVGTPEGMTEKEHARLDGLVPVYDCGKIRYIYRYESE